LLASPDIIKVEIWDVVDRAKNATPSSEKADIGIKLEHNASKKPAKREAAPADELSDMGLDASTVNVYRNCHAAIFLFDITKPWTFEYVVKQLAAVPGNVAILVLVRVFHYWTREFVRVFMTCRKGESRNGLLFETNRYLITCA
jgi:hypothetical protein